MKTTTKLKKKEDNFYSLLPDKLLKDKEFMEVWHDWIEYREEIKHALTKTAAKRQIKLLSKYTVQIAIAMVDRSINMGWRGIFALHRNHELMIGEGELRDPGATSGNELRPV